MTDIPSLSPMTAAFSHDVAQGYANGMRRLWRITVPIPPQRDGKGGSSFTWIAKLCEAGLALEAESGPTWIHNLSHAEVVRAAEHALVAGHDIPAWLDQLWAKFPAQVLPVVQAELTRQWSNGALPYDRDLLRHLARAPVDVVVGQIRPCLLSALDQDDLSPAQLDLAIDIVKHLLAATDPIALDVAALHRITRACARRIASALVLSENECVVANIRLLWLAAPVRAMDTIEAWTASADNDAHRDAIALQVILGLENEFFSDVVAHGHDRVALLERLLRFTHGRVRHLEDRPRYGAYTPDNRDHAERIRGYILNAL
jgi:hypothetical protein